MTNEELANIIKALSKELQETRTELQEMKQVSIKNLIVPPWQREGFETKIEWINSKAFD